MVRKGVPKLLNCTYLGIDKTRSFCYFAPRYGAA